MNVICASKLCRITPGVSYSLSNHEKTDFKFAEKKAAHLEKPARWF